MWSSETLYPNSNFNYPTYQNKVLSSSLNSAQMCSITDKIENNSLNENSMSTVTPSVNNTKLSSLQNTLIGIDLFIRCKIVIDISLFCY